MALSGNLMMYNDSALILNFPCDIFGLFKQVFVLTYMFYGQIQRYYFDLHKIRYKFLSVRCENQTHQLVPYCQRNVHDKSWLKAKTNIYEGKLNVIGDPAFSLSKKWLSKRGNANKLCKAAYNFLTNKVKAKVCDTLWTTVKGENDKIKDNVKPKNFATCFLAMTTRATNEYNDRFNLAYLVNRFMNPIEKKFFEQYGIKVEEDRWALSELIQWVWRSRIREGQPIQKNAQPFDYIPKQRSI
ncbi:hypothetical protein [Alkalihalobacillus deserti]|uniref:hypothetical protein n=1 Tax=Alkalihalobacillus deserti TaxID=2879466 RepID=UPI001D15E2E6|nr:hypothetical protein [Alkalihalobacillus deserti]